MRLSSVLLQAGGGGLVIPQTSFTHKGIIILLHGLNASASSFRSESIFRTLELTLAHLGWAVHIPSITGDGSGQTTYLQTSFNSNDTGSVELASVLSQWETWVTDAQAAASGDDLPIVVGGISWGGLYALQIAGRATTLPDGMFVHVPASEPTNLGEFVSYGLASLSDFNEAGMVSAPNTPRVPTLISYATDDERVGYVESENLATTIGADTHVYDSLGHVTNNVTVNAMVEWIEDQTF